MLPDISISSYRAAHGGMADLDDKRGRRRLPPAVRDEQHDSPSRLRARLQAHLAEALNLGKVELAAKLRDAIRRIAVVPAVQMPVKRKASDEPLELHILHLGAGRYDVVEGVRRSGSTLRGLPAAAAFLDKYLQTGG